MIIRMPRRSREKTDFGRRLASLRKARSLTQVQLAEAVRSTQRAISYYENEPGYPPTAAVIALAQALRVTTDELLGVKPLKADRREADAVTRRFWKKFRQVASLPEKDQRAVIRLINSLASTASHQRIAS
jgi:transcriptional regulator with XRE-family HTH domain